VKRLQFIRRAKLIGLPLAKIGELVLHLSEAECACATVRPHLDRLVRAQLAETEAKLAQLALLKEELERLLPKVGWTHRSVPRELCACAGTEEPRAIDFVKSDQKRGRPRPRPVPS
jgi:DNA-binding transcriptional MerR regulator